MRIHCTASHCRQWFTPEEEGRVRCPHCGRVYRRRLAAEQTRIQGNGYGVLFRLQPRQVCSFQRQWQQLCPGLNLICRRWSERLVVDGNFTHRQATEICGEFERQGVDARTVSLPDARRRHIPVVHARRGR